MNKTILSTISNKNVTSTTNASPKLSSETRPDSTVGDHRRFVSNSHSDISTPKSSPSPSNKSKTTISMTNSYTFSSPNFALPLSPTHCDSRLHSFDSPLLVVSPTTRYPTHCHRFSPITMINLPTSGTHHSPANKTDRLHTLSIHAPASSNGPTYLSLAPTPPSLSALTC